MIGPRTTILTGASGSAYEVGRVIGDGGMGNVYLAQPRQSGGGARVGELVALKILRPDAPVMARRLFYHEGNLLPRLRHPNIVRFVERGRGSMPGVDSLEYLVLEYIPGETLEDLLKRHREPMDPATVLGIVAQVTAALSYLHQRGIVHCDVKPGNIMLARTAPRAILLDFGIARAPDFTGQPVAVGTPQYMAPEQADPRARCDGRADVYALGVLIYELLTGQRLFARRTTTDILQRKLVTVDADELSSTIDPSLARVLATCLRENPAERFPSAEAVLDALRRAIQAMLQARRPIDPASRPEGDAA